MNEIVTDNSPVMTDVGAVCLGAKVVAIGPRGAAVGISRISISASKVTPFSCIHAIADAGLLRTVIACDYQWTVTAAGNDQR